VQKKAYLFDHWPSEVSFRKQCFLQCFSLRYKLAGLMLWRNHSSITLCCRYKAANEGIKLDLEECEAVMMAAWGMIDSSRDQEGEGFIASQLLAASFRCPNLAGNLSVHSKSCCW